MAYPRRLLGDGEQVVADLHPHPRALVGPAALVVVLAGLASYAAAAMPAGRWHATGVVAVLGTALLLAGAGCLLPYLRWRTTHYVLTNRRVAVRTGILARQGRDVPLYRINDVTIRRSVFQRLLGCGTLTVESAGERGQLVLADVPLVEGVQRQLHELVEADHVRRRSRSEPLSGPPEWR